VAVEEPEPTPVVEKEPEVCTTEDLADKWVDELFMATCDPENDQILNITSAEQAEQSLAYFGHECPVDTKEYTDLLGSIGLEQILECDEMNEDSQRGDSKKPLYKSQLVDAINSKIEQIQRKNLGDSFEDD
jgi:hypothetical protein